MKWASRNSHSPKESQMLTTRIVFSGFHKFENLERFLNGLEDQIQNLGITFHISKLFNFRFTCTNSQLCSWKYAEVNFWTGELFVGWSMLQCSGRAMQVMRFRSWVSWRSTRPFVSFEIELRGVSSNLIPRLPQILKSEMQTLAMNLAKSLRSVPQVYLVCCSAL